MSKRSDIKKVLIVGSCPIVIGQACEFDYCCCHAAFALKKLGYETIILKKAVKNHNYA